MEALTETFPMRGCELPDYVPPESELAAIVRSAKTVAVVGMSHKPERASYQVGVYLKEHGFDVIPVNPGREEIAGLPCYPDLFSIPGDERLDVVIVFRRPDKVGPIVDAAIEREVGVVWMQEGIANNSAARKARQAGIAVVMNRCFKKVHQALEQEASLPGDGRPA